LQNIARCSLCAMSREHGYKERVSYLHMGEVVQNFNAFSKLHPSHQACSFN